MASTCSRICLKRVWYFAPWFSISSTFQPPPMPKMKRPPDSWSSEAMALAVTIGSCCGTSRMPVPSFSFLVAAAAKASATNGSWVCE